MPQVRTSSSVSQNLGKDQTLPEKWNPKSNLHWICLMGDIVWFLKYKESWKSSVLYIARGSQATNREGCGCPDIHGLNSSYHWASNLTLKCCAKESLLDVQAFIRNIEKEVLKEICFPLCFRSLSMSDLFHILFWKPGDCFQFCVVFWKLNAMLKFDSSPNPLD